MTSAGKKVLDQALELSEEDRRRVAEALLDSVRPDTTERIDTAWVDEARRRAGRLERGEIEARDAQQGLAMVEARLKARR